MEERVAAPLRCLWPRGSGQMGQLVNFRKGVVPARGGGEGKRGGISGPENPKHRQVDDCHQWEGIFCKCMPTGTPPCILRVSPGKHVLAEHIVADSCALSPRCPCQYFRVDAIGVCGSAHAHTWHAWRESCVQWI